MLPNYIGRWNERYRSAPSLLSKVLTILELLMPPVFFILLLRALSILVAAFIGFHPYAVNSYSAIPSIGCVGDPVVVKLDRTLSPVPLGTVTGAEVWSYWASEDGRVTPKEPFALQVGPYGRHIIESELVRTMPIVPGRWSMVWEITVTGKVLGYETEQVLSDDSDPFLTVVPRTPENAPVCRGT